ncbi:MAG: adaptor protein MecA [Clostridia bacterium]|nr:adaptor protein MecA [Clostridia bacterium]
MELIRISTHKLKIMLTPVDMSHFELNSDSFGEDSAQMHRSFRLLLDEVRKQTDFDADDKHLSVQYFPSREGGCEMFISHLQNEGGEKEPTCASLLPSVKTPTQLRPFKKTAESFRKDCAYRFEKLVHLLTVCNRLSRVDSICESTAYRDEKGGYFLLLTVLSASPFSSPEELDFVLEYGNIENASLLRLYIREHARLICTPNAIQKLCGLA